MLQAGRLEVVSAQTFEAEALDECSRRCVVRVMTCVQSTGADRFESEFDRRACCFGRVAKAPELRQQVKTELVFARLRLERLETADARVRGLFFHENRPVLNAELPLMIDLAQQPPL